MRRELAQARAGLDGRKSESAMVGQSAGLRRVLGLVEMVSQSEAPTLGAQRVRARLPDSAQARGKRIRAAEMLGISRKSLWETLRLHSISDADDRDTI